MRLSKFPNPGSILKFSIIIALFVFPTFTTETASAQVGSTQNWTGIDGNYPLNWNYSPQRTISADNVNSLQTAWTFSVPAAVANYTGAEGVMVTPLVVNGIVYLIANWHRLFALDASTGSVVWYKDLPLLENYTIYVQPSIPGPNGIPLGHYHQMIYTTEIMNRPLVWVIANTYQVFALDANSGEVIIDFSPIAHDWSSLSGNFGLYDVDTPTILVDQARGILLFGPSVSEGQSSGRGYIEAWNVNTSRPKFLWRDYIIPPQDGSDPSWSLNSVLEMTHASVFNGTGAVDLKSLTRGELHKMLYGDWGNFGFDGSRSYAGAGAGWGGSWAIDENSGIAYVSTSTAAPDWNATQRPGLDLWSDSVMAIDLSSGKMIWGFQAIPHPLGDYDCSWNVVLANVTISGQSTPVVYKGCKNGYIFALNAITGKLIWFLKPQSIRWDNVMSLNPLNATQMTKYNWNGYPKIGRVLQNPPDTGALESDLAYDPSNGMVFAALYNSPKVFEFTDVGSGRGPFNLTDWEFNWGVNVFSITQESPVNTTVIGIDGSTGQTSWSFSMPNLPYRGGLTVSGGVVYVSALDGVMRFLNEANGKMTGQKLVGGELIDQPAVAQDMNGKQMLFLTDLGSSRWGPVFPGFVQALAPTETSGNTPQPVTYLALAAVVGVTAFVIGLALRPMIWNKRKKHRISGESSVSRRIKEAGLRKIEPDPDLGPGRRFK